MIVQIRRDRLSRFAVITNRDGQLNRPIDLQSVISWFDVGQYTIYRRALMGADGRLFIIPKPLEHPVSW